MKTFKTSALQLFDNEDVNKCTAVQSGMPKEVAVYLRSLCKAYGIDKQDMDDLGLQFGGDAYLVESEADFSQITGALLREPTYEERMAFKLWSTLDKEPLAFDVLQSVVGYTIICLCSNNAGGPTYFVPDAFKTENLKNSVEWEPEGGQ